MAGYPVDIRRCWHIKTNGTQCGSPALRNGTFCYNHRESRPQRVKVRGEGGKGSTPVLVPVFEDASSIQMMVRQVAILVLEGKIDNKRAGLVLYSLQIASSNLKRMEEEKPRPVQVVVDLKKVGETPIGMTPWSGDEGGHELEETADVAAARALREVDEEWRRAYKDARGWLIGRARSVSQWRTENREAERFDLMVFLGGLQESMEEAAETMGRNLRKNWAGWPVRGCVEMKAGTEAG